MLDWKLIKDSYPNAFKEFQFYGQPVSKYYGWDVVDLEAAFADKDDYEPDYQLRFVKGINTEQAYYYEVDEMQLYLSDLYNFFDKHNIFIDIRFTLNQHNVDWNWAIIWYLKEDKWLWHGTEDLDEGQEDYPMLISEAEFSESSFNGRYYAEISAFTKAFEILENKNLYKIK